MKGAVWAASIIGRIIIGLLTLLFLLCIYIYSTYIRRYTETQVCSDALLISRIKLRNIGCATIRVLSTSIQLEHSKLKKSSIINILIFFVRMCYIIYMHKNLIYTIIQNNFPVFDYYCITPKDKTAPLSNSDNYRAISLFNIVFA